MAVVFTKNLTVVTIQNPLRENKEIITKHQALGRSASGLVYTYDKGLTLYKLSLEFDELRQLEKDRLTSFWETSVNGIMNQFVYTDHTGKLWNARFLTTELDWIEKDSELSASGSYGAGYSGAPTWPTTTCADGIWYIALEMEVSEA